MINVEIIKVLLGQILSCGQVTGYKGFTSDGPIMYVHTKMLGFQ